MSCAERAGPIEMPFGVWTRVGPRNNKFGKGPDPLGGSGNAGPHAYADDQQVYGFCRSLATTRHFDFSFFSL